MNKKRNAFTLIELLAIIVILAIIAVITVPIILNIIENSKKGAITDSAYGYKDAVNKAYVQELSKPDQESLKLNGIYEVQNDGTLVPADGYSFGVTNYNTLPVSVSGEKPTSGTLIYDNNVLASGTLIIGNYTATYSNGSFTTVKTSEVSNEQSGGNQTLYSGPYATTFDGTYTYYGYAKSNFVFSQMLIENPLTTPAMYDFDYDDYEEPSNNNECPSGYGYYGGDYEVSAGCYYINDAYCEDDGYEYDSDSNICMKCQTDFYYNDETGKCEKEPEGYEYDYDNDIYYKCPDGYNYDENYSCINSTESEISSSDISNYVVYIRTNGTTPETCAVFGSGQASTVCITSTYYNDDYESTQYAYATDFTSDVIEGEYTLSNITTSGLKGYTLAKAEEMLSKGASSCYIEGGSWIDITCSNPSGTYCNISDMGMVGCISDNVSYSCVVDYNGDYQCVN